MNKKCWRCKEEVIKTYGNGMCLDCFNICKHASETHSKMMNDFQEGELSEKDFDKEYRRRLTNE